MWAFTAPGGKLSESRSFAVSSDLSVECQEAAATVYTSIVPTGGEGQSAENGTPGSAQSSRSLSRVNWEQRVRVRERKEKEVISKASPISSCHLS